jgi:uncharacterized protein (TIGR03437 family)
VSGIANETSISFQVLAGVAATEQAVTITAATQTSSVHSSISIMPANPPAIHAPGQLTVSTSSSARFTVTHSDPNGLPVSLGASNLPPGASFDTRTGSFRWTPTAAQTGTFNVTVTGTDSAGLSTSKIVAISVVAAKAVVAGLYNAASHALDQTCSPGSLAAVAGSGFSGQAAEGSASLPPAAQVTGPQVLLNNTAARILSASDTFIQFQCPALSPGTQISLVVQPANSQPSEPLQFTLSEATPSLFQLNRAGQGAILIAGTDQLAMPATDAMPSRPANIGEYLAIYANGLGRSLVAPTDQVVVFVGNTPLTPSFTGLAPGLPGVYQVNVQLIQGVMTGDTVPVYVEVLLSDGTVMKSNTVTVAIRNSGSWSTHLSYEHPQPRLLSSRLFRVFSFCRAEPYNRRWATPPLVSGSIARRSTPQESLPLRPPCERSRLCSRCRGGRHRRLPGVQRMASRLFYRE